MGGHIQFRNSYRNSLETDSEAALFLGCDEVFLAVLPVAVSISLISHLLLDMNFNSLLPRENAKALHVLNVHQI